MPSGVQDYPPKVIRRLRELFVKAYPGEKIPELGSILAARVRLAYGVDTKEFLEVGKLRREMGFIP